jgi:hypothetical protein
LQDRLTNHDSTEPTTNGHSNGTAPTTGRIFIGKMSFNGDVTKEQCTAIVDGIRAELPKYKATPPFTYLDKQKQTDALLIKFSAQDTPETLLALAQGAWDGAFNKLPEELRALGTNTGASVDEE